MPTMNRRMGGTPLGISRIRLFIGQSEALSRSGGKYRRSKVPARGSIRLAAERRELGKLIHLLGSDESHYRQQHVRPLAVILREMLVQEK
jgi:hypothetical protein